MSANDGAANGTLEISADGTPVSVAPSADIARTAAEALLDASPVKVDTPAVASAEGDLDKNIATAEKRLEDKEAYAKELQGKLSGYDREITKTHEEIKQAKEKLDSTMQAPQPQQPQVAAQPIPHQSAEQALISSQEFIDGLSSADATVRDATMNRLIDAVSTKATEAATRVAEENVIRNLHQEQETQRFVAEYDGILNQLTPEQGQIFEDAVTVNNSKGIFEPLASVAERVKYGPAEQRAKMLEFAASQLHNPNVAPPEIAQQAPSYQARQSIAPSMKSNPAPVVNNQRQPNRVPIGNLGAALGISTS